MKNKHVRADAMHPTKNCKPNALFSARKEEMMTDAILNMVSESDLNDAQSITSMINALTLKYCSIEHGDENADLQFLFSCIKDSFDRHRVIFELMNRISESDIDPTELEYEDLQEILDDEFLSELFDEDDECNEEGYINLASLPEEVIAEILSAVIEDIISNVQSQCNTAKCGGCCDMCESRPLPRIICIRGEVVRTKGGI